MPWLRYFWGVLLRAHGEFEARVGRIAKGRGAKADMVRSVVENRVLPGSISELAKVMVKPTSCNRRSCNLLVMARHLLR